MSKSNDGKFFLALQLRADKLNLLAYAHLVSRLVQNSRNDKNSQEQIIFEKYKGSLQLTSAPSSTLCCHNRNLYIFN
jgi:hypothetical protein